MSVALSDYLREQFNIAHANLGRHKGNIGPNSVFNWIESFLKDNPPREVVYSQGGHTLIMADNAEVALIAGESMPGRMDEGSVPIMEGRDNDRMPPGQVPIT